MFIKQLKFIYKGKDFKAVVRKITIADIPKSYKLNKANSYQFCWLKRNDNIYLYYNGEVWTSLIEALCQYNKFLKSYELSKRTRV